MKRLNLFITFLLLSNIVISQKNTDYSATIHNYETKIEKIVNYGTIKGMSIALIDGNRIVWTESFGYSDYENKIKADSNTIYGIGSVTKLFTGSSIMQLYEEGKINIDTSFSKYCPEFMIKKRYPSDIPISVRMLLYHHSGLPSDIAHGVFSLKPKPFQSIIDLVKNEYAPYPPDYIYSYSNVGYSLLGKIIENVSNQSYENYVKTNIFMPLQMNSSYFISDNSAKFSKGYDEKGVLRKEYGVRPVPAGAIKSNIKDMAKFAMSFLPEYNGTRILKKTTINEMLTKQNNNSALDFNAKYGLTWHFERKNSAGQIYYHTGGTLNHRSLIAIAPETNLSIVVLSNSVNSGRMHSIAMNLLDTCAIMKGNEVFKNNYISSKPDTTTRTINELSTYTGLYAHSMFIIKVNSEQNKLSTQINGTKYILTPLKDGSFLPQIVLSENKLHTLTNARIEFENINEKFLMVFHNLKTEKKQILGVKFIKQDINDLWKSRIGTYKIIEKDENDFPFLTTFELAIENEVLVFKVMEGADEWNTALYVEDDKTAFPIGLNRHRGSTLLFQQENGKEIVWFSGYKLMLLKNMDK